jgi:hypothetical protein
MTRGDVVQTFTIGLGRLWWVRVLGRSPLVRRSDRVEVLVLSLAVLLIIAAMPVVATIGISVHDARTQLYAEEAQTRHQVTATAIEDAVIEVEPDTVWITARASWTAAGRGHIGIVKWASNVKRGDQQPIWVDKAGESVPEPPPPSHADTDAIGVALSMWFGVAAAAVGLAYLVRRRLDHSRYRQWDRAISASRHNGGQANHQ